MTDINLRIKLLRTLSVFVPLLEERELVIVDEKGLGQKTADTTLKVYDPDKVSTADISLMYKTMRFPTKLLVEQPQNVQEGTTYIDKTTRTVKRYDGSNWQTIGVYGIRLPYWIELKNNEFNIWTKISISANESKVIYIRRVEGYSPNIDEVFDMYIDGLIGCWYLDEGSGTTAYDSSGYGHNGTIYGATWTDQGLLFDGQDDYVAISGFEFGGNITLCSKVIVQNLQNNQCVIDFGNGYPSDNVMLMATYDTNENPAFSVCVNTAVYSVQATNPLTVNKEHLLVGVVDNGKMRLYIDGQLANEVDGPNGINNVVRQNCYIGCSNNTDYTYFSGIIKDVFLFNKALTTEEIQNIMNGITISDNGRLYIGKKAELDLSVTVEQMSDNLWKVAVTNPNNVDLTDFQVKIAGNDIVTSHTDSLLLLG